MYSLPVPENPSDPEQITRAALYRLGIGYEWVSCDPAFADTAAFCERYGYPAANAGNTIIVVSKKEPRQYAACVVTGTRRLDVNRAVRTLMGASKVSFASAEEMEALTGMQVGGVTVFALPDGLPIFVDEAVMGLDYVILGTGGRNGKVKVAPAVLAGLPGARVVRDLARPREESAAG
ncbi:MAG TPA: YbaK/EbsC family protein [Candidatus Binatia bacterium]|nr:YbaK/EbsC family protein [Candidatus Binatia bacterium]